VSNSNALVLPRPGGASPTLVAAAGARAQECFVEFFTAPHHTALRSPTRRGEPRRGGADFDLNETSRPATEKIQNQKKWGGAEVAATSQNKTDGK